MRFMTIVKGPENAGQPPAALLEAIGRLGAEAVDTGRARVRVESVEAVLLVRHGVR